MRLRSLLMQLEIGMSIRRYLPATGTAGLERCLVSGWRRVPRPPPRIRLRTLRMGGGLVRGRAAGWPARLPAIVTHPLHRTELANGGPVSPPSMTGANGRRASYNRYHLPGHPRRLFDTVVERNPVVGIAGEEEAGEAGGPGLDGGDPLAVADEVLRDGRLRADDPVKHRCGRDALGQPQLGPHGGEEAVVVPVHHVGPVPAAAERPPQDR